MPPSAARPNRSTQGSRWELDQRGRESVQAVQKSRARPHFARFAVLAAAPYCLLTVSPTQTADCEEMTKKLFLGRKLSIRHPLLGAGLPNFLGVAKENRQRLPCIGLLHPRHLFRCTLRHHAPAVLAALGPEVDDPVRITNHVQIMFDDDD